MVLEAANKEGSLPDVKSQLDPTPYEQEPSLENDQLPKWWFQKCALATINT